ncbi:hypothetical protein [Leifsonia xyli]|uniref:hypothetical protein n=1 Tax=Leifsonia xyli TaxID=1575 RepID=UPI003D66D118
MTTVDALHNEDLYFAARANLPDAVELETYTRAVREIDITMSYLVQLEYHERDRTVEIPVRVIQSHYGSEFVVWLAWTIAGTGLVTAVGHAIESFTGSYEKFESARLARAKRMGIEAEIRQGIEDEATKGPYVDPATLNFKMEVAKELFQEGLDPDYEAQLPPERYYVGKPTEFVDFDDFGDEAPEYPNEDEVDSTGPRVLDYDEYRRNTSREPAEWSTQAFQAIFELAEMGFRITIEKPPRSTGYENKS